MKVKALYTVVLMALALLMVSVPVQASKTDDRIEASAKETYVFKTYLKGDDIKIKAKDGAVTLTGKLVSDVNGVKSVTNKMTIE